MCSWKICCVALSFRIGHFTHLPMWPKPCRLTLSCKIFVSIWQRILAENESYHVHCTSRGIPLYSQQVFAGILLLWSFGKTNIFPYKYSWNMVVINGSTVLRRENRKADRQQRKKRLIYEWLRTLWESTCLNSTIKTLKERPSMFAWSFSCWLWGGIYPERVVVR